MAEAGGARLLPIPCGAGQSTQAKCLSRAAAEAVAADVASSGPEAAADVGETRPNLHEMDTYTPHPASLSQCSIRRSHPRWEPYAVIPLVRICAGAACKGRPYRDPGLPVECSSLPAYFRPQNTLHPAASAFCW